MIRISRTIATATAAAAIAVAAFGGGTAQAAPAVDPVAGLIAAGVPAPIAAAAAGATPVAAGVEQFTLANPGNGNPGQQVDARIDHNRKTITVLQRFIIERSQLTAAWVNLRTGASGVTGLPRSVPSPDPLSYPDRAAVLPTGGGPVVFVVYGPTPSQTGLIPRLDYIFPVGRLAQV
ncbi:MAG: hypothetical protein NTW76_09350 [Corynebacteriales bacterium]|uniref:MPT63-like domain-containing protein n=1 Tax=Williamsia herbipolensis TaxID=1603258 RepID=A0AAU4K4A6_9NOCA|nr:hypothetical protein [Williamsia herbipolensis]MCX6469505.1 hypothetical protein [Mycobacteriales bacterium]